MMIAALAVALCVAPQAPTPPQAALDAGSPSARDGSAPGWIELNAVHTVVNDDIVTGSELARAEQRFLQRQRVPITTEAELAELRFAVRVELVRQRLRTQAGRSLGGEFENLDQVLDDYFAEQREEQGLIRYVEGLEARGDTADDVHRDARDSFFADNWTNRTLGRDDAAGQRPRRDRFVRPGEMRHRYRQSRARYAPPAVTYMSRFSARPRPGASVEEAREVIEELRRRAEAGESLQGLVDEYGRDDAQTAPLEAPVERLIDPTLREFARTADPGDVSVVLTREGEDRAGASTVQLDFFRMDRREDAEPPRPFVDGWVQSDLERLTLAVRDRWYLQKSESELFDAAYVSPPIEPLDPALR